MGVFDLTCTYWSRMQKIDRQRHLDKLAACKKDPNANLIYAESPEVAAWLGREDLYEVRVCRSSCHNISRPRPFHCPLPTATAAGGCEEEEREGGCQEEERAGTWRCEMARGDVRWHAAM